MKAPSMSFGATYDKMLIDLELIPWSPLYMVSLVIASFLGEKYLGSPLMAHHFMEFLIVDHKSAYHDVLGPSTLMEHAIATIKDDRMGPRECYLNSLRKAKPRSVSMILVDTKMLDAPGEGPTLKQRKTSKW